ncbi:ABC transporter substrate-binding protein [Paenibacillus sp. OAS669]|uniref:ABC transporter substrate-binding protein n=1 Tax=Paenibacillus sp. OAS669 TaxID=2663821 RepID=UPI00178B33DF|nr:ABC transporter substrate-binding protein [Paenibacillus sp. OAS669]MBE1446906.1 MarR-like DNA-binding transcriptional regulator SgrR of sgrS sRNA [Paenibacillus sp. OAS669]
MQLIEHYAQLYRAWRPERPHEEAAVTIPAIAACLHCTERNAKLIIKALLGRGWIGWRPGNGRGHSSRLRFLADVDRLLLEQAEAWIGAGQLQEAVKLLQSPLFTEQGRERLHDAIGGSFGFHNHKGGEEQRHLLRFPSYRKPGMLDPIYATRRTELHLIRQLFDTLVVFDPDIDTFAPGLAHHWEMDEEGRCWRFYLQKQVRFHNGAACKAEDVQRSLERLVRGEERPSPYSRLFAPIEHIAALHEYLIEIRCQYGCYHLLSLLASPAASIVPWQLGAEWPFRVIGTGPFKLTRRDDSVLVLDANPDYFLRPSQLNRVEMWFLPDIYEAREGEQLTDLQASGDEDSPQSRLLEQRGGSGLRPLRENDLESGGMNFRHFGGARPSSAEGSWSTVERHDYGCKFILLHQAKGGPLQQPELRNALFHAIRNQAAVEGLGGNRGVLADAFVRKDSWMEKLSPYGVLDDKEKALTGALDLQGRSRKERQEEQERVERCALLLLTYAGAGNERDAAWLAKTLDGIGITVKVRFVPYEELSDPSVRAEADLLLLEQPVDTDAEGAMWSILGGGQSPLRSCLSEDCLQRLDSGLSGLPAMPSREARLRQLLRLEEELLAERAVILWYRWRQMASFPVQLQGVKISAFGWVDYKDLWFRDGCGEGEASTLLFPAQA